MKRDKIKATKTGRENKFERPLTIKPKPFVAIQSNSES